MDVTGIFLLALLAATFGLSARAYLQHRRLTDEARDRRELLREVGRYGR